MNDESDSARKARKFVMSYVRKGPYVLYPDPAIVANVLEGLGDRLERYGKMYCPCAAIDEARERGQELVCPCVPHHADIERQGYCDCALFASKDFVGTQA